MNNFSQIKFYNFPHDFDKDNNFFIDLCNEVLKITNMNFSIHFYGCYPKMSFVQKIFLYSKSRILDSSMTNWLTLQQGIVTPIDPLAFNVWCTFENRRPPANGFDLTLSFDINTYNDSNFYLPLIYLYMNHKKIGDAHSKHLVSPKQCMEPRSIEPNFINTKFGFASSFINNPQQTRLFVVKELSKISKVSVYGRSVGNYVEDKISEAKKFWFNLCFENDFYPGYVTEKILEAWLAKSIPIYWGSDANNILNPKAYVNFNDFLSVNEFIKFISELYSDEKRMIEMIKQPILNSNFDYDALVQLFAKKLISRAV
jgi:hypothetical protein